MLEQLNYRHLRYFQQVAHEGHLTRAAERLNLSQSALSVQIRTLEDRLGHPLFNRVGRQLELTEVGQIVLDHADRIFETGQELMETLRRGASTRPPLRMGALSTLSRNFQLSFLRPLLESSDTDVILKSGSATVLLNELTSLALDVVLSTEPPSSREGSAFTAHRIAEQPVGIHGHPSRLHHPSLSALLQCEPLIVPTESSIRTGFESLIARLGVSPRIIADVDDMAMVRLLTRENMGVAFAPSVVLADELASGLVVSAPFALDIVESFYAITIHRSFPHPVLRDLINQP